MSAKWWMINYISKHKGIVNAYCYIRVQSVVIDKYNNFERTNIPINYILPKNMLEYSSGYSCFRSTYFCGKTNWIALEPNASFKFNSIILFGLYYDDVIVLRCNTMCKTMLLVTAIRLKGLVTMFSWLNSLTRYNYPCRNQMNSSEKHFCLSFYYAVLLQVCDTWQSYLSKYFLLSNLLLRKYAYTAIRCYQ